jgi:hypothetical protein
VARDQVQSRNVTSFPFRRSSPSRLRYQVDGRGGVHDLYFQKEAFPNHDDDVDDGGGDSNVGERPNSIPDSIYSQRLSAADPRFGGVAFPRIGCWRFQSDVEDTI